MTKEMVNHPDHYNSHPSGIECIQIIRHMTSNIGSVIKYCWRAGLKNLDKSEAETHKEDLEKARWYLNDEIVQIHGGRPWVSFDSVLELLSDIQEELNVSDANIQFLIDKRRDLKEAWEAKKAA